MEKVRRGQIMRAVLEVLAEQPDGMRSAAVIDEVKRRVPPTAHELGEYENNPGVVRFDNSIRFATIGPVKAGWLIKTRRLWSVTDEGVKALKSFPTPASFADECYRLYRAWKSQSAAANGSSDVDDEDEGGESSVALELAEESAFRGIADYLAQMPPYDFQALVAALLEAMGYHIAWEAPPGPDGGVDIIATTDPLGAQGPRIKVQVKRHQARVSVDGIRSFIAVLGQGDIGVFVNTGGFTRDAASEARNQESRRLTLLDTQQLVELWVEHSAAMPERSRLLLPLRPVHFLAPPD